MELSLFSKYQEIKTTKHISKRSLIIEEFVNEINKERPCTYMKNNTKVTLKKVTGKAIAIKLAHVKSEFDLMYFLSVCKDYRNRNGSFSKCFFGSLKTGEKLA
jgi:hypothetical protein